jgi:cytochrome P450
MSIGEMSFLEQYEKAPSEKKFPLVRNWIDNSPLPFFKELRAKRPIFETPLCTLVAHFDDIVEVLRLPSIYTVALYEPMMGDYLMAQDDTPLHYREKSIMKAMLNRDDLPRIRAFVAERAKRVLEKSGGRLEMAYGYGRALPTALVQDVFGLDGIEPERLIDWSYWNQYDAFHNQPFDVVGDPDGIRAKSAAARQSLAEYVAELIPRRIGEIKSGRNPQDVVARMLQTSYPGSVGFPIERLARNVVGLLIGTVETSSHAALNVLQELLRRHDVLPRAVHAAKADDPTAFDGFVWEALRFAPILPYLFRKSARDYLLAAGTPRATRIQKGAHVLTLTLSATFDPGRFPNPDSFDPTRTTENTFHFGYGTHECLGRHIAAVLVPEMVRQVLRRPGVKAESAIDFGGTPFPERYWVSFDA